MNGFHHNRERGNWSEGQQIPEQAGYSPHPIAAEATHAEADLPNVRPVKSSVTFQIAPLSQDGTDSCDTGCEPIPALGIPDLGVHRE